MQHCSEIRKRVRALARLGEMADRGDFDAFLGNKAAYRGTAHWVAASPSRTAATTPGMAERTRASARS